MLGVAVDCVRMDGAIAEIVRLVEQRRSGTVRETALVATVNPEFVMRARRDRAFRGALDSAALRVPDGSGVVWALRRAGHRDAERVAGVDLVPRLARACATRGFSLYLLGARAGVAATAADRLRTLAPGLQVAGAEPGSPRPEDDVATAASIRAASPDVLLVAYGAPTQEVWVARNRGRLGVPVAIGVGGAFDLIAGRVRRAPVAWQRLRLEWAWRLWREPWRAWRMAVLPEFALLVLFGASRHRPT